MYSFAIEAEMGYTLSRLEIDGDWCDSGDNDNNNSINGGSSSSSQGPKGGKLVNLDNEVVQITKLRSEPHECFSRGKRGLPISPVKMLAGRECNFSGRGRFTAADCCHVLSRYLPVNGPWRVDKMDSRAYVSQFSADGSLFVAGFQGSHIRIYNVENGWKVQKDIHAKSLRWTVTDTSLSPDQDYLVYASMSPIVHIVNIRSAGTESLANINEIHDGLDFSVNDDGEDAFGIFSVKFSTDGRELVAGSSDDSIYVYDLIANKLTLRIAAHSSDVNTVCFADETGHLIYSGSDDNLCKVWDRRCLNANGRPAGVLMGHLEGITFLDSRGDGRYFISNGKDQTIKLWDIRKLSPNSTWRQLTPKAWVYTHEKNTQMLYDVLARSDIHIGKYCMHVAYLRPKYRHYDWDYRWMEYPSELRDTKHPYDQSLSTYKGHSVLRTLIRCYFSPAYSTGQKYIYTGSNDSCVYIYDVVSGAQVARLENHSTTVRDCSWHPFYPMLVSSSWDGVIARCEFPGNDKSPAPMNLGKSAEDKSTEDSNRTVLLI